MRTGRILIALAALLGAACGAAEEGTPDSALGPPSRETAEQKVAAKADATRSSKGSAIYPATRAEDRSDVFFGVTVRDPYRWLEDGNSKETQAWMTAQDDLARRHLASLPGREPLQQRLKDLMYFDAVGPPVRRGKRLFYSRRHKGAEKSIVYFREEGSDKEQALLDPNTLRPGENVSLGVWEPSYDGKIVAYTVRKNNADDATLYIKDVTTGKVSDIDVIPGAKYAEPSFTPTGDGFYYVRLPVDPKISAADLPGHSEIRFHKIGQDPSKDEIVREKTGDPRTEMAVSLSREGRYLFGYIFHNFDAEVDAYYRDLKAPKVESGWKPLLVGKRVRVQATAWKDHFYILTNDGAPRGRVFRADAKKPDREGWQEIIKEPSSAVIEAMQVVGGQLAITSMKNAASELEIRALDGKLVRKVDLPSVGGLAGVLGDPMDDEAYYGFTTFTRPSEIYKTSIKKGGSTLFSKLDLPVDPSPYEVKQVWYTSKDGTKVSMFLVHKKGIPMDGSTPFVMTGYGGFGVSVLPAFKATLYPWLEAGGAFAMPNLRGGGEYGKAWHEAGMKTRKQNVFDDFIAAAEHLISSGYTKPERLAIRGGSNGGLLVAAAMVQRPELFGAVICQVPVIDMTRFHLHGDGKTWIGEYGSVENEEELKALVKYSPYHNVKEAKYPAVLMLSADSDDRVDPLHARKMIAALQAKATGDKPLLLRIERNAGHGGGDMAKQTVEQGADVYAFLMKELGLAQKAGAR
jgi:prolyl oligopeptidase